ncbi:hypothetical protein ACFQ48_10915 [Hymenobacter caeli]|uniref:Uncharacterized protein n=1 Tax=Hymenobacter caeli TaxID=2735894 RepID=A0ABX2FSJ3_9BACT|nr:hypothetical protein [Hymenobacter caeli]NRT19927.1 hypothetical protein [Hymenobacter caeli]
MKAILLAASLLLTAAVAQAQTVPLDPTAPVRAGNQGQTTVPPANPGLNQSTIQGPPEVQRTLTNRDAQPSRLDPETGFVPASPEGSPTAVPDVREQPLIREQPRRESTDIVPSRDPSSRSSKTPY